MNRKMLLTVILVLVAVTTISLWVIGKRASRPAVTVTLRIAVTPAEQLGYVNGRGNSAQIKYLLGKQSGVKPALAQRLLVRPVPDSFALEARVGVLTKEDGRRYAQAFVPTLQGLCGKQAQLTLAEESVR